MLNLTDRVVLRQATWLTEVANMIIEFTVRAVRARNTGVVHEYLRDLETVAMLDGHIRGLYYEEAFQHAYEQATEQALLRETLEEQPA